jgi:hypothetical protein
MQSHVDWLKTIPVKELVARQAIPAETHKVVILREVLRFYGVSSVAAWLTVWDEPAAAARRPAFLKSSPGPTSAWLRLGHPIDASRRNQGRPIRSRDQPHRRQSESLPRHRRGQIPIPHPKVVQLQWTDHQIRVGSDIGITSTTASFLKPQIG